MYEEEILQELTQQTQYQYQIGQNQSAIFNKIQEVLEINNDIYEDFTEYHNNFMFSFCVYTGCINLVLMIILLMSLLPKRKGVLKK